MKTHCKHGHELSGDNLYLSPTGLRGCRACRSKNAHECHRVTPEKARQYRKTWNIKNPGYDRERFYGITQEEFERKLKEQDNQCAICDKIMVQPNVDHEHGDPEVIGLRVRDLLCASCNKAIGFLQDDPRIAQRAADYLKKWKR